ncbi:MEI2-RELATED PROTEIN [Encephalitozoon cuniculi GB-M1]|uniref:Homeobox protein HD-12 n=1 Tax=Encephalitozoon cuniculi (strain GB-M1) TaxID=284813 RepID=HD12_ENCCU|nr:uncharacterized protein ECU06_0740 [Encephalitozoon cuniculi GB-M1]Q8SRR1.1 RecName: Full=Homeobox protein HD-12; AltName: Full=EcHD-12 [Encephalitozoon cuniculi GB-M1]CAD25434.1 MEI2-RELATED PROTEIN [Encephalitozoon cuniculi GB-M1]DAA01310.1 TPA_exp: TALE homeodomain protein EcHD-12 [Encephalitozoon cuniculi]
MMRHINEILIAKEKYFQSSINDHDLKEIILKIQQDCITYHSTDLLGSSLLHKLILILIIEKFKSLLLFEKNIISIFDLECVNFQEEMNSIMYVMNEVEKQYLRSDKFSTHNHSLTGGLFASNSVIRRINFPKEISKILRKWLKKHLTYPYPSKIEKKMLSKETGLKLSQIDNWFANARRRILPFMKEKFIDFD